MPASNYTETNIIEALLRGGTFQQATRIYVGLHTGNPTDAGGSEVTAGAWPDYARVDAAKGGTVDEGWTASVDGVCKNELQLIFPVHNGPSDITISHFALYDAATGGNMLTYGELVSPRTLSPNDVYVAGVQQLTVQVT